MVTSDWKSAFDGEIRIKNISEETIEDWKIEFDFDHKIDRFWTAIIEKQEGNHYYIKNAGYNANIKPGQTVVLGFSGNPGNVIVDIENSVLTQIITEKPSTEPVTDYYKDSDGDGLKDYIEVLLGTNYNKTDTDGDGLSDYEEYYLSETDPLLTDTNNNGVLDGNEDKDDDGIINIEELAIGTAINDNDSDNDGLEDGTEINTYQTNPMNVDTDQDGLTDYEEVMLGLDPTKPMTDGITIDSKRTFSQILSKEMIAEELLGDDKIVYPGISGEVSGLIDKNMMIDVSSYREFDSNRAVIGNVIEIQMTYATADFKLEYDISKIISAYGSDYAKDLLICKLGGENGFEPVDTVLYGTVMTGSITGEGSYFILNLNEFLLDMGINVFGEAEHAEVIETYGFDGDSTIEKDATTVSVTTDTVSLENEIEVLTENGMVIGDERYTVDNNAVYVPEKNDVEVVAADDNQLVKDELPGLMLANADFASIKGIADIVFVIDATGSMQDEISNVAKNLNVFSEELVNEYSVNANFAVVEYQDITWDGVNSTLVHKNGLLNWYSSMNVDKLRTVINSIYAKDGGDTPETAIDGLETARRLNWRTNASKFIILLTDAGYKVNNQYGVADMAEEISLLNSNDIITSVITSSYYKSSYDALINATDGIYANIYGNFSEELLKLAAKIGNDTNKGQWIILDDYQVVRLNDPIDDPDEDTDDDGIKDFDELASKKTVSLNNLIKLLLIARGLPSEEYTGKTSIEVYSYKTNPVLVDTDYDGLNDNDVRDMIKRDTAYSDGNAFAGSLSANDFKFNVEFTLDYRTLFGSNTSYNKELSVLGSIYATAIYQGTNLIVNQGASAEGETDKIMNTFGLDSVEKYSLTSNFSDDDVSEIAIGHRNISYLGKNKEIIVVAVRGTNGTIQEWSSNFDVGADTSDYWDQSNPYWRNHNNHKGFDVAANRLDDYIQQYIKSNIDSSAEKTIYIVGHSRGAAIANILGKLYEDRNDYSTFVYTFATPMTTTATNYASYKTIFNIINEDDIIPQLPLDSWGFEKYGTTKTISVNKNYENKFGGAEEGTWEWLFGQDYNDDGGTSRTLKSFEKIAKSREDIYKYTCPCHGDGSSNSSIQVHNTVYYFSKDSAEEAKDELWNSYTDRMKHFVTVEIANEPLLGINRYSVTSHQTTAFFMMSLADLAISKDPTKYNVAPRYQGAKTSFILSAVEKAKIGGLTHPHMPGTYYLIARNNVQPLN